MDDCTQWWLKSSDSLSSTVHSDGRAGTRDSRQAHKSVVLLPAVSWADSAITASSEQSPAAGVPKAYQWADQAGLMAARLNSLLIISV